ncbi:Microcystin-dependent protein [Tenacibaculum sp. MAR_2009_124]|uniref:hypothetical protein n=1 Tax=Tenacibaculum sp. MAR_2009_124 TaxID=1250059 RepID=UPI00089977D2|nr:hypothetical protein [Tenacibaculum sp. MAR_2009_124]SEB37108.1 Microcystin-dependent protein [Tenacibaculum sp. MAR_2009_124]
MRNYIVILIFTFAVQIIKAQIDANSVKGIPVVSNDTEMNSITGASEGSILYNITHENIYLFNGTNWIPVNRESISLGEVKYSVLASDHGGWYILNGRTTSSLPASAQTNATNLGFTTNIPNSQNRILKHPTSIQSTGDIGGSATSVLTRANLPNINFTGTTSSNGSHRHTFNRSTGSDQIRNGADANRTFFNQTGTTNTSTSGNHNHTITVNSGGSNQSFERYQPYLVVNTFIYLGL